MKTITSSLLIHPEELSRTWIDSCAAEGIPTLSLHPAGGEGAAQSMQRLLDALDRPDFRGLIDEAEAKGLTVEYEMHAARYLLPAEEFGRHPGWFRENRDGVRTPDCNCCASDPDALAFMAKRAAAAARKLHPKSHRYFFWMDDARDAFCHCEACRTYSPSDQQLLVMNRLLAEIRKDDPEATLAYLAYCECMEAPEQIRPADGIFLEYAPFNRDFHQPLADAGETNTAERRSLQKLLSVFGCTSAKVLDYWYDNSLYSGWKKPPKPFTPDVPVLDADFAYYRSLGFTDISSFACFLGDDYRALFGTPDLHPFAQAFHVLKKKEV